MSIYKQFCKEEFDSQGNLVRFGLTNPDHYNFGYDVVDAIAAQEPDKTAMVWRNTAGEEHYFSFAWVSEQSNRAANVFRAHGVQKGDRVMVMLKRHYEYWFTAVALHKLGAILVPVTHMLTPEDIAYRVSAGKIKAAVCTCEGGAPENIRKAIELDNSGNLECVWTIQRDFPGFLNLTEEMKAASPELERQDTRACEPMLMYFTSGTTGYPKGVIHDHTYTLAHIITAKYWQNAQDGGLHFTVAETGWGKASWGKIYGQWLVGSAVMVFDFDNFDPKQLTTIINQYHVTTFCAPPTVYRYLVKKDMAPMPGLKYATTAGEALSPEVFKAFQAQTGITLMEGFGQTESTLILGNFVGMKSKPGAMGHPSPLYHVELLKDDGTFAKTGELGEIVIVPPKNGVQHGIFVGYFDNDELYDFVWRGGVYHTGDTAWRDEDGYFWFNGRVDDLIKTGGFRVGSVEIENILMEHPAVMECSVVGVPDTMRGQAIKAVIVLSPGYQPSLELQKELRQFCNSRMAEYKWVRSIEFVEEMPKTISGKIRKVELREQN